MNKDYEIVIDVGAGSILPSDPNRDVEATRRGIEAIRKTTQSVRDRVAAE